MSDVLFTPPEPEGRIHSIEPRLGSHRTVVQTASYGEILRLAIPLILSSTGVMIMQTMDGIFLSHYSELAIAAMGPGSLASWLAICLFVGTAGYTSALIAQYVGANKHERVGAIVWQGLYLSLFFGALVMLLSVFSTDIFRWVGHPPELVEQESQFFRVTCWGAPIFMINSALSGFFSGRGNNTPLMFIQLSGLAVNGILSYSLVFGKFGFPEWGVTGAATATVSAQVFVAVLLFLLFIFNKDSERFGTRRSFRLDMPLLRKLMKFGLPAGFRMWVEILAWTAFVIYIGRIGTAEVAATSLSFRLNGLAFFPVLGFGQAISILVGQAQGQGRSDLAQRGTWRGMVLVLGYMTFASIGFWFFPIPLCNLFMTGEVAHAGSIDPHKIQLLIVDILKFVAIYSTLDGINLTIVSALQGAGDTSWTLIVSAILHIGFLFLLAILDYFKMGLYVEWTAATIFIMSQAVIWVWRFQQGKWKSIQVVEHGPEE